jgi:hypothetical protein
LRYELLNDSDMLHVVLGWQLQQTTTTQRQQQ